jgi:hypothetical protein
MPPGFAITLSSEAFLPWSFSQPARNNYRVFAAGVPFTLFLRMIARSDIELVV